MSTLQIFLITVIIIALIIGLLFFGFYKLLARFQTKNPGSNPKKSRTSYESLKLISRSSGSLEKFQESLYSKGSSVGLILGSRGSGKSALGLRVAENFRSKTEKHICAIGFDERDLPSWIKVVEVPEDIENNSFVLIDEGGVFFSSRDSMTEANKIVSKLMLLARHKDLCILFITQNSSNLEINTIRQADYLMLKPSSLLQLDFERKRIKEIYDNAQKGFNTYKKDIGLLYIYSDDFKGFVSNSLPSFWSKKISKALESKKLNKDKD